MFLQNRFRTDDSASNDVRPRWNISRQTLYIFSWTENFVVQIWQWGLTYKNNVEWGLVRLKLFSNFSNDWALEFSNSVGERFGETFATIDDLIEYYLEHKIPLRNGQEVVLRHPLRRDSQPPSSELWYALREEHLHSHNSKKFRMKYQNLFDSSFQVSRNSSWNRRWRTS